jgi:alpha-galactosidase
MTRLPALLGLIASLAGGPLARARADELRISALDLAAASQQYGNPAVDRTVDGHPLRIQGQTYDHGFGTHAASRLVIDLHGSARRFTARVGVDDETNGQGSVAFRVIGDRKTLFDSGVMRGKEPAKTVDVDVSGVTKLILSVTDGGDGITWDHADWADAVIAYSGAKPTVFLVQEPAIVLTPKPRPEPRINGAKLVGVRPGSPFLFTAAATGEAPLAFEAAGLPDSLTLDRGTGIITGSLAAPGTRTVRLTVTNRLGKATRELRIVVGDQLALTPPMGWNSWNCFAGAVTEKNVRDAAEAFIAAGLRDHGWTYINIDDFWMTKNDDKDPSLHGPERDAQGRINANPRFPDMKGLTDFIHAKGLKAGLYSSPGPRTCGGCLASYQHEAQDAARFAEWGFDYLKYDWCSYGDVVKGTGRDYYEKPYSLMGRLLREQKRDIVFSLCQYGMDSVWEWGSDVGGQCWRTTGDITDSWGSMSGIGFAQAGHERFAGPGHWNDPDMLVVGYVGWGPSLHPTHLTPNEQYTHISLWSLLASPLLIGCDLTRLDEFTKNLLTNDEVIDVNQDPLGAQARRIAQHDDFEVWIKPLEDGGQAVGLFNLGEDEQEVKIDRNALQVAGKFVVRDLWRQVDIGPLGDVLSARVPRHGVKLVKLSPAGGRH